MIVGNRLVEIVIIGYCCRRYKQQFSLKPIEGILQVLFILNQEIVIRVERIIIWSVVVEAALYFSVGRNSCLRTQDWLDRECFMADGQENELEDEMVILVVEEKFIDGL